MRCILSSAALVLVLAGCDKDEPKPRDTMPTSVKALASALHTDASALEMPLDPPAPVGDLRAEIDRFTTLDSCVADRASLDPLVGDALHAIGYDTFLRDSCRVLDAAKARDPKRCVEIAATPLRARCEMLVALMAGDADMCPWDVPVRPALGREPTCLAVTLNDARVCAAVDRPNRPTCEALAGRDAKRCDAILHEVERAMCKREVARLGAVLKPPDERGTAPLARPWGQLKIKGAGDEAPDPAQTEIDMADELARGVAVSELRDGLHFDIGTIREPTVSRFGTPPVARPHIGLSLIVSPNQKEVKLEHCELGLPGATSLVTPGVSCNLKTIVGKLEKRRGGDIKLTLEGEIGAAPRVYKVKLDLATFVRDFVTSAAILPTLTPYTRGDAGAPR